jgi:hypothetical protein
MDLSRTRAISFATIGQVTGQLKGIQEPGLLLTPPETGNGMFAPKYVELGVRLDLMS